MSKRFASFLLSVALAPTIAHADQRFPSGSQWHLDLARSDFGEGPALSRDDFTIDMESGSTLSFSEKRVFADGRIVSRRWSGKTDGSLEPFAGEAGAMGSYNVHDGAYRVVEPDGGSIDASVSFSEDVQTMILSVSGRIKGGKSFQQTLTYQRQ